MESKGIGTKIYEVNEKLGVHKVTNKIANAMGKKDCGCKKKAQKIDNIERKIKKVFTVTKDK